MAEVDLRPLPPAEAVAYFRAKGYRIGWDWRDTWAEEHAQSFTVAKATSLDILRDIRSALDRALSEGRTFEQFRAELEPLLQAKGWWGRQPSEDPQTKQTSVVQLGSTRRLRTIYDVNIRTAMAAGRWTRIEAAAATRPYLRYVAVMDRRTRPEHAAWHGTILRWDHPWWQEHYPPCGWNCRCTVEQLSERDLQRNGWAVSPDPVVKRTLWTNSRTGVTVQVPAGVDPGFAHNVGQAGRRVAALDIFLAKVAQSDAMTGAAAAAQVRPGADPYFRQRFADWLGTIDRKMPRGERRLVGVLSPAVVTDATQRGIALPSAAISVSDTELAHMLRDVKDRRGAAVGLALLTHIPAILDAPTAVLFDAEDPAYVFVFPAPDDDRDRVGKLVIRVAMIMRVDRVKVPLNTIRTGGLVPPRTLGNIRYHLVEGEL